MSFLIKNIRMTLDPASIQNAIDVITLIQGRIKPAMLQLIDYLREKGVEIAKAELIFFQDAGGGENPAYATGALSNSIKSRMENEVGYVEAGEGLTNAMGAPTNYAIYVEYGNTAKHKMGWWYPSPDGWWTPSEGKYAGQPMAHTWGMLPRPFMQNTLLDLEEEAKAEGGRIVAEYLAD